MRLDRSIFILLRLLAICLAAGVLHAQVTVSLSTSANSLQGNQIASLQALVTGTSGTASKAVTWNFSPNVGSFTGPQPPPFSAVTGISTNQYQAPQLIAARQTITITATSVADTTQSAAVVIQLTPLVVTVLVSPSTVTLGPGASQKFSAQVTGTSQTGVTWSINPQVGSIDSSGNYTAPSPIPSAQTVSVIATSVYDTTITGTAKVTLQAVSVTLTPTSATLSSGQTQQFTATVTGGSNSVIWYLSPVTGNIDSTGLYTAPASIPAATTVTVTVVSTDDPSKSATAKITLQPSPALAIAISPTAVTLTNNQTQQFLATVTNSSNTAVTWSISPQTGTITTNGFYTAPAAISGTAKVTVTATSVADTTKSASATVTLNTFVDIGTGAPTQTLQQEFRDAFNRNGFSALVSLPPLAAVQKLGTTGYLQRFSDANKTAGVTLALATVSPTAPAAGAAPVVQLLATEYAYYNTVGATTAGYPTMDTQTCPSFDPANSCVYDFFDKGYALFAYQNPLTTGQNFTVRLAFYTEWTNDGGMTGPGRPVDVETAITAFTGTTATVQTFAAGAIYTINSGPNKGKTFGVVEPLYDLYLANNGPAGPLGLPTGDVYTLSSGANRQTFEGASLQYTPGSDPVLRLPVATVSLAGAAATSLTLNMGASLALTATPLSSSGVVLAGRPVSWSTSNSRVISIQANGVTAVLSAAGPGAANVTASIEGVVSPTLNLVVIAPCCQIGDGAPLAVQQAFQDALARNHLTVQTPVPNAASRVGSGYVQMVTSADPSAPGAYLLAQSDQLGSAFVVAGAVLVRYQALGGAGGPLGYPTSDMSAGGTQLFQNASALAGNPVRLVSGGILAKWTLLGFETGTAGAPVGDASAFSTFGANSGSQQSFSGGSIYSAVSGPRAGQAYFVSGLILARYNAIGGAQADFGMPVSDEFITGGIHQQNFEGGIITYSAGDQAAVEHASPKVPGVIVAPSSIAAGGSARLAVVGFPNSSTIRVSVTGEPDFLVTSANGAYSWDMFIPLTAKSGTVAIHAADTKGTSAADGTLTVKGFADNRIQIAKVQGDNQDGLPGALLPLALRVALLDSSGSPVVGAPVVFQASPGVQLSVTSTVSNSQGYAETLARLPGAAGVALVTADAPSIARNPVTFGLLAAASSLSNFPGLQMTGSALLGNGTATVAQKGALLTAVTSILLYHQSRGELAAPNGTATAATLNQFLKNFCVVDPAGHQLCDGFLANPNSGEQIVNLWRAAEFTGGVNVSVENPTVASIADLLANGSPLLLSLGMSLNGAARGGHFVVATGVASDGSIMIQDPSPLFARTNLNDYLNGFNGAAGTWKADLRGVVRFALSSPSATRFMVAALSQQPALLGGFTLDVRSAAGACGLPLDLPDSVDSSGNGPAAGALLSRIQVCDGAQPVYQIAVGAAQPYQAFVTDLAARGGSVDVSGSAVAAYKATRPQLNLVLAPQVAAFTADAVVNGATFVSGIAPGGIMSIFGSGLAGPGIATSVDLDGVTAQVLFASPFQINAVVPSSILAGAHNLRVQSAYGTAQQTVTVSPVAPVIFLVGNPAVGAVLNQDYSLNTPDNPLPRGQVLMVYATGLGAVTRNGSYSVANATVTASVNGVNLPVAFAGLAPGFIGLYQVNLAIPASMPPGSGIPLILNQGGQSSNAVLVAVQ